MHCPVDMKKFLRLWWLAEGSDWGVRHGECKIINVCIWLAECEFSISKRWHAGANAWHSGHAPAFTPSWWWPPYSPGLIQINCAVWACYWDESIPYEDQQFRPPKGASSHRVGYHLDHGVSDYMRLGGVVQWLNEMVWSTKLSNAKPG